MAAAVDAVAPLLGRSFFLDQPNVVGMGVIPWDVVGARLEPGGPNPVAKARRMVGPGALDDALAEEDPDTHGPDDPEALARGADLLQAVQRLDAARAELPEGAPDAVHTQLGNLRAQVAQRLRQERRQSRSLDGLLRGADLRDPDLVNRLREPPPAPEAAPAVARAPRRGYPLGASQPVAQDWPQALEAPPALEPPASASEQRPVPGLAALADLVGRETGETPPLTPPVATPKVPERGAAASAPAPARITVGHVAVDGLSADTDERVRKALQAALRALPQAVARRLANRPAFQGTADRVDVPLVVHPDDAPAGLADRIAQALVRQGAARVDTLQLGVSARPSTRFDDAQSLLSRLQAGDSEGLAQRMLGEKRQLDGALKDRLARFFGTDFSDVMVFAGPMAGALARSLQAEAVTHGKMVFFDPKHFRTDSAQGEALIAHELAHTQQGDDRDSRMKEAEALAIEASYLDWIQPGGASLAEDNPLDPTAPSAAMATGNPAGLQTAKKDRHLAAKQGPREEAGEHEERVKQVLDKVRELLGQTHDQEGEILGKLGRLLGTRI